MASIYDAVSSWNGAPTTYNKYDIVKGSDNKYYYSIIDSNNNQNPTTVGNLQVEWDGYILLNSKLYPNFSGNRPTVLLLKTNQELKD